MLTERTRRRTLWPAWEVWLPGLATASSAGDRKFRSVLPVIPDTRPVIEYCQYAQVVQPDASMGLLIPALGSCTQSWSEPKARVLPVHLFHQAGWVLITGHSPVRRWAWCMNAAIQETIRAGASP